MPVDPSKREEFLEYLVKEHKDDAENIIYRMHGPVLKVPFVSPMLTWATTGGMPVGHFGRWYGPEGCLGKDTFLRYEVRKPTGERQNHKGGTIESLYLKFNGLNRSGHDVRKRQETIDSEYFLPCMNDAGSIFHNKVVGVIKTGIKPCLRITTATGNTIVVTADHKFFVGNDYMSASELEVGDQVFIHNNTRRNGRQPRIHRPQTTVKHHPYGQLKTVNGYDYKQLYVSRLVVEANMNGISYDEYRQRLNDDGTCLSDLDFLHLDLHVHHVNEDCTDNSLSNLAVVIADEHNRHHALKDHDKLRFIVVEDEIVSIDDAGVRDTYDVQMADPFNNFVADGIVVHNSGKSLTNWGLVLVAQNLPEVIQQWFEIDIHFLERAGKTLAAHKVKKDMRDLCARFPNGMETIVFDTEQRADPDFMVRLGIDVKRVEIINNNIIEEVIKDATTALDAFHIVIIDSATNAMSIAEANLEPGSYEQGTGAKAWSRLKQFRRKMDRHENILIIVDQMRSTGLGSGKMYRGPDSAPPNVRFLRHNASLAIEYDTGKKLYLDRKLQLTDDYDKASPDIKSLGTNGKEPHGLEMRCKVQKNSTGKPHRNARVRFCFPVADIRTGDLLQDVGFDEPFELVEIALHYDLMEQSGHYYYPLDEDYRRIKKSKGKGDVTWHSEAAAREAIIDDEDYAERIVTRLRRDMVI